MKRVTRVAIATVATLFSWVTLMNEDVMAGQFKTLNTASLGVNQQNSARSSPKNTASGAIEMEVYEWQSGSVDGNAYQCRITQNATGQPLNISLVGLDTSIIASCSAPASGTCNTTPAILVGGAKFQCVVATQCCFPVSSTANYTMAGRRLLTSSAVSGDTPLPSGVIDMLPDALGAGESTTTTEE